jgi:hypothetical protein
MSFRRERISAALCVVAYLSMLYIYVFLMPATNAYHDERPCGLRPRKPAAAFDG